MALHLLIQYMYVYVCLEFFKNNLNLKAFKLECLCIDMYRCASALMSTYRSRCWFLFVCMLNNGLGHDHDCVCVYVCVFACLLVCLGERRGHHGSDSGGAGGHAAQH